MKILANENVPFASIRQLREAGYSVASVQEDLSGANDQVVLARANLEQRIILTFDRDYGELIYRLGLKAPAGIIYIRYDPVKPEEPAEQLLNLIRVHQFTFAGKFTVLTRNQIRQRPIP